MKIHTIVVYPSSSSQESFSASLNSGLIQMDPYEKAIKDNKWMAEWVRHQQGIHEINLSNSYLPQGIYYGFITDEKIAILAADEKLTSHAQYALYKKLNEAQTATELNQLIQNPQDAIKSDIEKLNEKLEDIKQIMHQNINKVIERGVKLEELISKSESLARNSFQFGKEATKIKKQQQYDCLGLFGLAAKIKNLVWKDSYEYEYRPVQKPNNR